MFREKVHRLALAHTTFVDFWVLWTFSREGVFILVFLVSVHVDQNQILYNGTN